jgi:selenocysteine-specific translation elongation factor
MHHVVSIPLDPRLAELVGKKGSENSITFYNWKKDNDVIVALTPSSIEEKFYAVAESMLLSDEIIVSTSDIDKLFGELVVACSLLDKHVVFTDDSNIDKFLSSIKIKDFEISTRTEIVSKIVSRKPDYKDGAVRIDIDKAFPVKGLGTVALGIVTRGTVKVHDELYHSNGKKATIRSMQSQDMDIMEASPGTRVGLALKGIEHDEIEKGDLISSKQIPKKNVISAKIKVNGVSKEDIQLENRYNFISNFSLSLALVEKVEGENITLKFEKPVPLELNDEFLLLRSGAPRIFASGRVLVLA